MLSTIKMVYPLSSMFQAIREVDASDEEQQYLAFMP